MEEPTTIEVEKETRTRLRTWKSKQDMTYEGALNRLLDYAGDRERLVDVLADATRQLELLEDDLAEDGLDDARERVSEVRMDIAQAGIDAQFDKLGRDGE